MEVVSKPCQDWFLDPILVDYRKNKKIQIAKWGKQKNCNKYLNCYLLLYSFPDSKKHFQLSNGDLVIFNLNSQDKLSAYSCSVTNLMTQEQIYSQSFPINLEGKRIDKQKNVTNLKIPCWNDMFNLGRILVIKMLATYLH